MITGGWLNFISRFAESKDDEKVASHSEVSKTLQKQACTHPTALHSHQTPMEKLGWLALVNIFSLSEIRRICF